MNLRNEKKAGGERGRRRIDSDNQFLSADRGIASVLTPQQQGELDTVARAMEFMRTFKEPCIANHGKNKVDYYWCFMCHKIYCGICQDWPLLVCEVIECHHCFFARVTGESMQWSRLTGKDNGEARKARCILWCSTHRAAMQAVSAGRADSTVRQYRSSIRAFRDWCVEMRLRATPAKPEVLLAFLNAKHIGTVTAANGEKRAVEHQTLEGYRAAWAAWEQELERVTNIPYRPSSSELVMGYLKMHKKKYASRIQEKGAVSQEAMARFLAIETNDPKTLHEQLVGATMYLTLSRVSEGLRLRYHQDRNYSDVVPGTAETGRDVTTFNFRGGKTLAAHETYRKFIIDSIAPGGISYSRLLKRYIERVGIPDDAQFLRLPPSVQTTRKIRELNSYDVSNIARTIVRFAGQDSVVISSHSFRRGGGGFLLASGMTVEEIQDLGMWRSRAVLGYLGTQQERAIKYLRNLKERLDEERRKRTLGSNGVLGRK